MIKYIHKDTQGRIQDFWKGGGGHIYKGVGGCFADFVSFVLNIT